MTTQLMLSKKMRGTAELGFSLLIISALVGCGSGDSKNESVSAKLPPTTGLLQSLAITPAASSVAACSPVQFVATATYSDGTLLDVTNGLVWEVDVASSNVAIASTLNGQMLGIAPGVATVRAWTGGGQAASAALTIANGTLNSIALTPASAVMAVGGTLPLTATATCSNNTLDISNYTIWTSSMPSVVSVSPAGLARAVAIGASTLNATAGTIAASAVLSVQ